MAGTCIGIDLGGTFVKFARADERMNVLARLELPTPSGGGADGVIEVMLTGARRLIDQAGGGGDEVLAVGIGSPGPLDLDAGEVLAMPNIPGFENVPLRDRIADGLGLPTMLDNDANLAALGEYLCGGGAGARLMVLLTLGTGIGGGIVVDGALLHGAHGIGAELGHIIVAPDGERCGCGQTGCLERYASAAHLARHARTLIERDGRGGPLAEKLAGGGDVDAKDVCEAAAAGDALAGEVWDRALHFLAVGCVTISRTLDPDMIVLGGGMAGAGDRLLGPLRRRFAELHWRLTAPQTELRLAELGNDAGVTGAAGAAWDLARRR